MSVGEFYKMQQKLHLLGKIVPDRDALRQVRTVLCVQIPSYTHS